MAGTNFGNDERSYPLRNWRAPVHCAEPRERRVIHDCAKDRGRGLLERGEDNRREDRKGRLV